MNIKITFGNNAYSHTVYVAKITDNFILGLDFLEKYNFILDFKDSSLHSTTEDVTLFRKGVIEIKPCYRIIASSDFTISARQELILKGYTDQEKNVRLGVLEFPDFENFPKGVLVASTFVDITKEAIPVRCANVSDKPKIIKKGKVLTTCTPVTYVERSSFQTSNVSSENLTEDLLKTTELTQKQRNVAEKMLREFKELFPNSSEEFGRTNLTKHRIDTGNHPPIKQHPRRLPFAKVEEFILDTDASHANVGPVLSQEIDGQERVIAYWTEMKYGKTVPVVRQITASATSHLDPWSDEEVREAQMKDPDLKPIIECMESSSVRSSW
ncbi:retrovirus-related Pol polyprotein from transposon 412 [Nephila pilipes]|uniref:Retrovirus-related Pol polyprotein from transposon 412 n=1 Tax=Nephila pilipes TaxID=299642 RepID=A0A8X6UI70_NEPPI|nr:retrovirus-related Pol polyprotein from transposon 412 [Nephila pilipes]